MKARNPNGGDPIDVHFPEGDAFTLWSMVCRDCGAVAGGRFSGPGLPEPEINSHAVCPRCGGKNLALRRESPKVADELRMTAEDASCR